MRSSEQVLTIARMQAAEQALIDGGETISTLMERAGKGAADYVWRMAAGQPVTVLCGPGNNGGDGYVIARVLQGRGLRVRVIAPLPPRTPAAIAAREAWGGLAVESASGGVFVDCLFGSGLSRPLDDGLLALAQRLAHGHDLRVAIDLPSGIEADRGELLNRNLPLFDLTVALGAWKPAHWLMPAMAMMGERRLVDIGVERVPLAARILGKPVLHVPAMDSHKYSRGFVGVVGGAMPGAGQLAARAAMRAGAGYVKLFADNAFAADMPELVVESGLVAERVADPRLDVLVVGPGLGRDGPAREKLEQVLRRELPTVVDGDALHLLDPALLAGRREGLVLTPHAGELEQLFRACEIEAGDRFDRLLALAHDTGAVIIAKGPDTVIAAPDGNLVLCASARAPSWLSIAGSGDVLAGIVAARLAAGLTSAAAAEQAVWLHARAGQLAGPACLPGDIIGTLPVAYKECL